MMKGSQKDEKENEGKKFIVHHGDMSDEEILDAMKRKKEKKKGLKN